jgi:hypothetical protein
LVPTLTLVGPVSSVHYPAAARHSQRVYSLCSFDPELVVPQVELIDAESDERAIALARSRGFRMRREVWDHDVSGVPNVRFPPIPAVRRLIVLLN